MVVYPLVKVRGKGKHYTKTRYEKNTYELAVTNLYSGDDSYLTKTCVMSSTSMYRLRTRDIIDPTRTQYKFDG